MLIKSVSFLCRGMPDIQWLNLDPVKLMEQLSQFTSLEGFREMLDKAQVEHTATQQMNSTEILFISRGFNGCVIEQVGHAYMNRPCLDHSDPDCPLSAPNKEQGEVSWN